MTEPLLPKGAYGRRPRAAAGAVRGRTQAFRAGTQWPGTPGDFGLGRPHTDASTGRLTAFACAYVDFARHNDELMAQMLSSKTWPDAGDLIAATDRTFAPAVELLRQAAGSVDITAADADTVDMAAVLALLHGLAFVAGHGLTGTKHTSELVAGVVRALVEGIRPR
ncbi:TetR-like C-terminal domain-containing protein [Streptomyces sp. NPDC006288]|uniref:TetR-like C-terminal domain-containing protein n=1 Tax=Streptomyces sp. NPDC006288 TaxID=3156743 RepID=UPI0033B40697